MKIATINAHTPYLYSLAHIRHKIHFLVNLPSGQPWRYWQHKMRPKPPNVVEVNYPDFVAEDYDILILQTPEHLQLPLAQASTQKIFVQHNMPDPPNFTRDFIINNPDFTVVFSSQLVKAKWKLALGVKAVAIEIGVPDEFYGWEGSEKCVLAVVNHFAERDRDCGFNLWRTLTRKLPTKVVGYGNSGFGEPAKDFEELKRQYSKNRVYFHTTGNDCCMALREALMAGMPVVSNLEELSFENEVEIFKSANLRKLRGYLELCLEDYETARKIGQAGRQRALKLFDINTFVQKWENLLGEFET